MQMNTVSRVFLTLTTSLAAAGIVGSGSAQAAVVPQNAAPSSAALKCGENYFPSTTTVNPRSPKVNHVVKVKNCRSYSVSVKVKRHWMTDMRCKVIPAGTVTIWSWVSDGITGNYQGYKYC